MPSYKEFYGSRFINAADLPDQPVEVSITGIRTEDVQGRGGMKRTRVIATLEGWKKPLILNSTNATAIAKAKGEDFMKWKGAKLRLRKEEVMFQGEMVEGVRVEVVGKKK